MIARAWGGVAALAAGSLLLACTGPPATPPTTRPPLFEATPSPPSRSVAQWRYHPLHSASLQARQELGHGRSLFVGRLGERWLVDEEQQQVIAAAELAPQALIAVLPQPGGAWAFVGERGSVYQAASPLGALSTQRDPPQPLREVSAADGALLATGQYGQLWRSGDAGASWQTVGPAGVRFSDVALGRQGHALALAVPEQHWFSPDAGKTWQLQGSAPLGLLALLGQAGEVVVRGVLGRYRWSQSPVGGAFAPLAVDSVPELQLPLSPPRGPSASALLERRAVVLGQRYHEVERAGGEATSGAQGKSVWRLWSGAFDGALSPRELPDLGHCSQLMLAGFEHSLTLACLRGKRLPQGSDVPLELWHSRDEGHAFEQLKLPLHGNPNRLQFAAGAAGVVLLGGACAGSGCEPQGLLRVQLSAAGKAKAVPSVMPSLVGDVQALLFSRDGKRVYAFGSRSKSDVLGAFISEDGGVTFDPRDVDGVKLRRDASSASAIVEARAAEDSSISLVFASLAGSDIRLVLLDEQARVLALSAAPSERASIAAYGARAVAVERNGSQIWESANAGSSWLPAGQLPAVVCTPGSQRNECVVDIACQRQGCVFGTALTRLGWSPMGAPAAEAAFDESDKDPAEPLLPALSCALADEQWQRLPLVQRAPSADQAAIGNFAWFALGDSPIDGEVVLYRARGDQKHALERRSLLAPAREAAAIAYHPSLQVEGAVAIRYRIPPAFGQALGQVEVAWEDLVHGTSKQLRLQVDSGFRNHDAQGRRGEAQRADPELVSIADGGVYLRVHAERSGQQPTYFVDGTRVVQLPQVTWPNELAAARDEWIRVGQSHFPILFLGSTALARASLHEQDWSFSAHSVGWVRPEEFGLQQAMDLTYWQGRPALHLAWHDPDRGKGWATVLPFAEGEPVFTSPIAVPTQGDLPALPAACSAEQRAHSPRVVAEAQHGARHPLLISDAAQVYTLFTDKAVLHGAPEQPCVAAFEASLPDATVRDGAAPLWAIVEPGEGGVGWLFRRAEETEESASEVEFRSMSCRYDDDATAPAELPAGD